MSRIVLAGLVLTLHSRPRPVTQEESKGLAEEEIYLRSVFEQWLPNLPRPRLGPEIRCEFVDGSPSQRGEASPDAKRNGDSDDQDHTTEDRATSGQDLFHAAIVSDLEHMQNRLDELLNRWRESVPRDPKANPSAGPVGSSAATSEGTMDTLAEREQAKGDETGAEPTPPDHAHSFWSSSSLAELAVAQGVGPVEDLEGIAALWPLDDDPDELLDHVLAERAARRRALGSAADR